MSFKPTRAQKRNRRFRLLLDASGASSGWASPDTYSYSSTATCTGVTNIWCARFNNDGSRVYTMNAANGTVLHSADLATAYVIADELDTGNTVGVTNTVGSSANRCFDWNSDGTGIYHGIITSGLIGERAIGSSATAYNPTIGVNFGFEAADTDTFDVATGWDHKQLSVHRGGTEILTTSNDSATHSNSCKQVTLSTADDLTTASVTATWDDTEVLIDVQWDSTGESGWALYDTTNYYMAKFTCSTAWDISTATLDTANKLDVGAVATQIPVGFFMRPDESGFYVVEWQAGTSGALTLFEN